MPSDERPRCTLPSTAAAVVVSRMRPPPAASTRSPAATITAAACIVASERISPRNELISDDDGQTQNGTTPFRTTVGSSMPKSERIERTTVTWLSPARPSSSIWQHTSLVSSE
jgi:hypothetical protein